MRFLCAVSLLLPLLFACGGEGGSSDGGGKDLTTAPLAPLTLSKKTTLNEYHVVLDVPEGTTVEWSSVYFFLKNGKGLSMRVTPNHAEDLEKRKASFEKMNIEGFDVLVDEENALLVEVRAHSGTDYEVYYNTEIDGTRYACQSVGLVPGPYSKEMAERILACFRTLRAP
jgi:hypothetical protein